MKDEKNSGNKGKINLQVVWRFESHKSQSDCLQNVSDVKD